MEDSQDTSQIAKRGKKACTECRQQKARCDASQRQPCTRCERMKTECVISDPFRREHKRQKYSLLEKEAEEMRRQLGSTQPAKTYQTETAAMTLPKPVEGDNKRAGVALAKNNETKAVTTVGAGIGAGVGSGTLQPAFIVPDPDALPPLSAAAYLDFDRHQLAALVPGSIYKNTASGKIRPEPLQPPVGLGPTLPKAKELALAAGDPNRTQPRSLGGLTLSGEEIDAIFDLFYRQYAHFLPILDITSTPNQTYGRSPFLFWAVIGVASRTCAKNPTIFLALTKHITQLAFTAPLSGCGPWTIVQGLLLVLSWPFPKDDGDVDIIFPLSGLLLHVAMQYGMHNPLSAHEFYKTKLPPPSDTDILRRSELWAYTIIVYQRSCLMKGQPPRSLPEVAQDVDQRKVLHRTISPGLRIEMVAQEIVTECGAAVNEYGVINLTEEQERGLDLVLRAYEQQIANLHSEGVTSRDKLHIAVASLSVQGMHLLKNHTLFSDGRLRNLEATAYTVIDSIQSLARELESLAVCPSQVIYGLLLAGAILLRILKGPRTTIVDNNRVKDYFMTSLNLAKSMSVTNSDLATKIVTVLSQLYNSTKAFRRADGRPTIRLRIRSRLALCPIIDAIWWWKDEFEPPLASTYCTWTPFRLYLSKLTKL
ncbi:uncharacterized protein BJX67DRAFT_60109 [Aspergillus lucknowensis]|uniref:Zn(2)-C6 fungal-type domain-containing protein n=1 Tax=Aspergillus lucknowensis TaxID=176173 RepID=A0ABR4LU48_9EURO